MRRAAISPHTLPNKEEVLRKFCSDMGFYSSVDEARAISMLDMCSWSLETTLNAFKDKYGVGNPIQRKGSSSSVVAIEMRHSGADDERKEEDPYRSSPFRTNSSSQSPYLSSVYPPDFFKIGNGPDHGSYVPDPSYTHTYSRDYYLYPHAERREGCFCCVACSSLLYHCLCCKC